MDDIKALTNTLKYAILFSMSKLSLVLLIIFCFMSPVFAKDTVQTNDGIYEGKIFSYSDGVVQIRSKGVEYSVRREKNAEFYGDYVRYKSSPIIGKIISTNCRLVFVDLYDVIFELPSQTRVKLHRYRIKDLVINAY